MSSHRHTGNHCHCGNCLCAHTQVAPAVRGRRVRRARGRPQNLVVRPQLSGLSGWVARKLLDIEVVNGPRTVEHNVSCSPTTGCTHFYTSGGVSPTQATFHSFYHTPPVSPTLQFFSSSPTRHTHHVGCPASPTRHTHCSHSPPSSPTQLVHPSSPTHLIHPSSPKAYLLRNNLLSWNPPKHIVVNKDIWAAGGRKPLVTDIRADPRRWSKVGQEAEVLDIIGDAQSTGLLGLFRCRGHCATPEPLPKLNYIRSVGTVAYGKHGVTNVVFNLGRRVDAPITTLHGCKRLVISLHGIGWTFPNIDLKKSGARLEELVVIVTPRSTPEFKSVLDDDDIRRLMNSSKWNGGRGTIITPANLKHFGEQVRPLLHAGTKLTLVNLNMAGRVPRRRSWDLLARKEWRQRQILEALKFKKGIDSVVFKTGPEYSELVGKDRYKFEIVPSKELIEGHTSWWSSWR